MVRYDTILCPPDHPGLLEGVQLGLFQPGICQLRLGCIQSEVFGHEAAELCLEVID